MEFEDIRRCASLKQVCKRSTWGNRVFFALEDYQPLPRLPFEVLPEILEIIRKHAPRGRGELIMVDNTRAGIVSMVYDWKPSTEEEAAIDWMTVWP